MAGGSVVLAMAVDVATSSRDGVSGLWEVGEMPRTVQTQRSVVAACYLGWTLDAFDFFIMVFVFGDVAREFGISVHALTYAVTLTLATRAIGAFLFGRLADRYGRRPALMASILSFSILGVCTGLAPNATIFFIVRALFGLAMGGEWGVGASLTMESIPASWRGPVSGLLQSGYPSGYLLASLLYLGHDVLGWRGMFLAGALPALLVLYIRKSVPESPDWTNDVPLRTHESLVGVVRRNLTLTIYAVCMMTCFNFFSHGTQDIYPRYLQAQQHLAKNTITTILVFYNLGAIAGGIGFGALSQRIGRRRAIGLAAVLSLSILPLWAFSSTPLLIGIGGFLMQVCVQGAWGVVPVHLNELSPRSIRGTFPGFTYQLGNLLAAANLPLQTGIADALGGDYRWPLAGVAGGAAILITLIMVMGREAKDVRMGQFGSTEPTT